MFNLNDKVIYPGHGVAVVEDIIEKSIGEAKINFFKLVFLYKDMTILVPIHNATVIGIRLPSTVETVHLALKELDKKPEKKLENIDFTPSGWNRRNKDYQLKMQSGLLVEIAKIYRDLMYVSQQKDLSFGERALLQTAEELLTQELLIIKNVDKETIVQEMRSPFKKFFYCDNNDYTNKSIHQESASSVS